jgi:hypothetical protein
MQIHSQQHHLETIKPSPKTVGKELSKANRVLLGEPLVKTTTSRLGHPPEPTITEPAKAKKITA